MIEALVAALEGVPVWLRVILLSSLPITEYQLSIPIGIHEYHLSPWIALGLSLLGGLVPFIVLYFGLESLRELVVRRLPCLLRPLDALLDRAKSKLQDNYAKYGMVALFLLLVVPFPLTGVWTASLAAVALKIPFKESAWGVLIGMFGGAVVVTLVSVGGGVIL